MAFPCPGAMIFSKMSACLGRHPNCLGQPGRLGAALALYPPDEEPSWRPKSFNLHHSSVRPPGAAIGRDSFSVTQAG